MSHDPEPMSPSDPGGDGSAAPRDLAAQRLVMTDAVAPASPDPGADDADSGDPRVVDTAVTTLGEAEIGLWQVEPGVLHDVEVDEVFLVLGGAGSVTFADGSVLALRPGVLVQLRDGDRTVWEITETLRKLYVAHAG